MSLHVAQLLRGVKRSQESQERANMTVNDGGVQLYVVWRSSGSLFGPLALRRRQARDRCWPGLGLPENNRGKV